MVYGNYNPNAASTYAQNNYDDTSYIYWDMKKKYNKNCNTFYRIVFK